MAIDSPTDTQIELADTLNVPVYMRTFSEHFSSSTYRHTYM